MYEVPPVQTPRAEVLSIAIEMPFILMSLKMDSN